ncbi:MAG: hypothetical protein RPR40_06275 [Bermanella sp.]|jgi:hypothetical protein
MSYIFIIIIVLAVLGVLLFAHRVSQKDKLKRKIKAQSKRMLHRADEIWEIAEGTGSLIHAPDIIEALMDYYIFQIRRREEILSMDDSDDLIHAAEAFKSKHSPDNIKNELKNDHEINQAKRLFSRTSKVLRTALTNKLISGQSCISMRNALKRRILDLQVDAYERLGDAAGTRNDPAVATNFYKFAKKLLIESDLKFEGKNQRVRDITEKTQTLFGNTVEDQLTRGLSKENDKTDEHGIPKSVEVMQGNKKNF